jgi:hypothetical protein
MLAGSRLKTVMRPYVHASGRRVARWLVRAAPKVVSFGATVLTDELALRRAAVADELLAQHRGPAVQGTRACPTYARGQDLGDGAGSTMLTSEQIENYERDGYLLLRGQIDEASLQRFERGLVRNPPLDGETGNAVWPAPSRYTLAKNCLADPDLGFMAERAHRSRRGCPTGGRSAPAVVRGVRPHAGRWWSWCAPRLQALAPDWLVPEVVLRDRGTHGLRQPCRAALHRPWLASPLCARECGDDFRQI